MDSTGGSTGGVSSSGAGTSSGGTTASYDAGHCVDLDVLTYDTSCEVDSDCIDVTAGRICDSYPCTCGGTAISAIGQSRYDAALASALASVGPGTVPWCGCPYIGNALCVHGPKGGVCTFCPAGVDEGMQGPPGCPTAAQDGSTSSDGGPSMDSTPSADGATCVDIDVSTYDTTCHVDSDCIDITAGTICGGYTCICGGASINVDGQARYDTALASVRPGPGPLCSCPSLGRPRCVQGASGGVCAFCPGGIAGSGLPVPAGCPDGG